MFLCPNCQQTLTTENNRWHCSNKHSFDVGKNGDVNLLLPQQKRSRSPGDSKAMVTARRDFLASGIYSPIADALSELLQQSLESEDNELVIADAGCGEGYYLRELCDSFKTQSSINTVGWDISKDAIQSAAKQMKRGQFITASNAQIPLASKTVDVLLSLFGFQVEQEFARIVKNEGCVISADVGENHLIELRQRIYPEIKTYKEKALFDESMFNCINQRSLIYHACLNQKQIMQLLLMTPHFFRAQKEKIKLLELLSELTVTVDVILRLYQRAE